jgi:hypothetical protein
MALSGAREPLVQAIVHVADRLNAQNVANTVYELGVIWLKLGPAHGLQLEGAEMSGVFVCITVHHLVVHGECSSL